MHVTLKMRRKILNQKIPLLVVFDHRPRCFRHLPFFCFVDFDIVNIKLAAGRHIELQAGLDVSCLGNNFGPARGGQIALRLNDEEGRRRADSIFLLLGVQSLLLKDPALHRRGVLGAGLFDRDEGVLHVNMNLIDQSLHAQLILPEIDGRRGIICLGVPIAQWNAQLEAHGIVRKIAREYCPRTLP